MTHHSTMECSVILPSPIWSVIKLTRNQYNSNEVVNKVWANLAVKSPLPVMFLK